MWIYKIASGELWNGTKLIAKGYSGFGADKNNPADQAEVGLGPIPCGVYMIGEPFDSTDHGPHCLRLTPMKGTNEFGRNGFLMHGDSKEHPGAASHGCIIMPRAIRELISKSPSCMLTVVER